MLEEQIAISVMKLAMPSIDQGIELPSIAFESMRLRIVDDDGLYFQQLIV
jgi:hypothetical protein